MAFIQVLLKSVINRDSVTFVIWVHMITDVLSQWRDIKIFQWPSP